MVNNINSAPRMDLRRALARAVETHRLSSNAGNFLTAREIIMLSITTAELLGFRGNVFENVRMF
jgi:hypothetical protein